MAPGSPVKRLTRARAAAKGSAVAESMDAPPRKAVAAKAAAARKTKIESMIDDTDAKAPPAKRTTTKKAPPAAPLATAPRRRVKVTPLEAPALEPAPIIEEIPEESKPKTKRSKTTTITTSTTTATKPKATSAKDDMSVPATKGRPKKAISVEDKAEEAPVAPKTRGRPRKPVATQEEQAAPAEEPVRQTRTRAGSGAAATQATASTEAKASAAPRKKVTFQDVPESDKENVPLPSKRTTAKKGVASTATGMRAKPVRKPVVARTRRNAAISKEEEERPAPRALTPKKITQVARSSTPEDSEEDELNGAKTPVRDLSMSARRMPGHLAGLSSPVKKLDFTQSLQPRSPEKATEFASIMSPARRPPLSPFKDALRESPKRGDVVPIFPTMSLQPNMSTVPAAPGTAQSMLFQSPKRGPLDNSMFAHSTMKPQKSPFKASLLQSPARRLVSPQKQKLASDTPEKAESTTPIAFNSPSTAISCQFRAETSPDRFGRVHTLTEDELAREADGTMDFDESVLNIRSPIKLAKALPTITSQEEEDGLEPIIHNDLDEFGEECTNSGDEPAEVEPDVVMEYNEDIDETPGGESGEGAAITELEIQPAEEPVANILFRASRFRDDDESSEDELQADMTPDRPLMSGRPSLSAVNIRSRLSTGVSGVPTGMGFTPLASQLSGWLASSPERQGRKSHLQQPGMFSPLAAQHIPGEVQVSRRSTPQQLRKYVGPRQSTGVRKSVGSRLSLAPSMAGTPGKSFFAEEMSLRELDQQSDELELSDDVDLHEMLEASAEHTPAKKITVETGHTPEASTEDDSTVYVNEEELTTDLINQTMYTDTALVDLAALAKEAEDLAPAIQQHAQESSSSSVYGDENATPAEIQEKVAEMTPFQSPVGIDAQSAASNRLPSPDALALSETETQTPIRPDFSLPRFVNTVISKVPLRPEGDISPIKMPKKRSRSFSAGSSSAKRPLFSAEDLRISKSNTAISFSPERKTRSACPSPAASTPGQRSFAIDDFGDSTLDGIELPDDMFASDEEDVVETGATPSAKGNARVTRSTAATPARTPLKAVGGGVLHGAVVYVDVYTTEGADASGIFVELLTQMGAKCIKDWRWNPRASLATAGEDGEPAAAPTPAKIGITHVVYKDGGRRTLEKVRDAKGEVWCVGVGWVLDCERQSKWLDESTYAVDALIVPRGGSRRRKSMEPRALMNANGSLGVAKNARRSVSGEMTSQMREELINTPVRSASGGAPALDIQKKERESLDCNAGTVSVDSEFSAPPGVQSAFNMNVTSEASASCDEEDDDDETLPPAATPTGFVHYDIGNMSPATPYLMGQGSKLVQMSCPPKQTGKGIFEDADVEEKENSVGTGKKGGFPVSGLVEDEKDEGMRKRLEAARRRTMGWRPRIGSPLGRI